MNNFGQFLIENNVISEVDYIRALIKQEGSTPSVLESIVELNLIPYEQLVTLVNKSRTERINLLSTLNEEDSKKITEHRIVSTKSIAEVLYEENLLDANKLKEQSKLFSEMTESNEKPGHEQVKDSEDEELISSAALESLKELQGADFDESQFTAENNVEESTISAAALESLKELQGDDFNPEDFDLSQSESSEKSESEIVKDIEKIETKEKGELTQIYSLKKHKKILKIEKMIKKAVETDQNVSNYLNSLYRELYVIKGVASISNANKFCKLVDIWEIMIDLLFKREEEFVHKWAKEHISTLGTTMNVLWEIRERIDAGEEEDIIFEAPAIKNSYIGCIAQLKSALNLVREG